MDATTMPSTTSQLATKLISDYPEFMFIVSETNKWVPLPQEIHYNPNEPQPYELFHELAHALLGHTSYNYDIALLGMERDAWHYATTILAPRYSLSIPYDYSNMTLETYREWLHSRSLCPRCQATGVQTKKTLYTCLACHALWQVNEARTCGLRRHIVTKKHPT